MTDLLLLTRDLVAFPSESHAEAPFVDWIADQLAPLAHLTVERVGDNLVARTTGSRSTRVLLAGHTDTVPANGNAVPRIEGDTLWGLGSTDMKGGLAVMLELARTVTRPAVEVTYVFYAGEEVAAIHNGLGHLFRDRPDLLAADVALLGEPTEAVIEAGCQGTMRFVVTIHGARAHTARPWMGRNAIHRLGRVLAAVEAGRGASVPKLGTPTYDLDRRLRPAVSLVAAWVSQLSRELEIETSLVATRADIEALLAGDPAARLSVGWRAELVGERIRQLVDGEAALAFDGSGNLVLEDRAPRPD